MRYIPVENDINKALAFANSLDPKFNTQVQKLNQKPNYINTIEVVENLQNEGWKIYGVDELREKRNRKINKHFLKMNHPDFKMEGEGESCISITNSCDGKSSLNIDMGMIRYICTNGLVGWNKVFQGNINHNESKDFNYDLIGQYMKSINLASGKMINEAEKLKSKILTPDEINELAYRASLLRYTPAEKFDFTKLLNVRRNGDQGSDLWVVYNRIQENLTKDITNNQVDIKMNKRLFSLVEELV